MWITLTVLLLVSIITLVILFVRQSLKIRRGKAYVLDSKQHDPLSERQLENMKLVVTGQIKRRGRIVTIILLKLTIKSKKVMKQQFDRAIIKLSKMAFPKEPDTVIGPNRFLEIAEDQTSQKE